MWFNIQMENNYKHQAELLSTGASKQKWIWWFFISFSSESDYIIYFKLIAHKPEHIRHVNLQFHLLWPQYKDKEMNE